MAEVDNPLFARFYARIADAAEPELAPHRVALADGLAGTVVEVGAGTGAMFGHYPPTVDRVVAIEPERYLRVLAGEAAAAAPVRVDVVEGVAERLPLPDGSADAVLFFLVLCSVGDQAVALSEAHRVLRPDGILLAFEHVRGEGIMRAFQRIADVTWPHMAGGCHTGRDTVGAIAQAGFRITHVERLAVPAVPVPLPTRPHARIRAART